MPLNWEAVSAIATVVASLSVVFTLWQLVFAVRQQQQQLQDELSREYREIMEKIPVDALLGRPVSDCDLNNETNRSIFHGYFDLSSQQAFLFADGRIDQKVWHEWEQGICSNMRKPAFRASWNSMRADLMAWQDFTQLAALIRKCPLLSEDQTHNEYPEIRP